MTKSPQLNFYICMPLTWFSKGVSFKICFEVIFINSDVEKSDRWIRVFGILKKITMKLVLFVRYFEYVESFRWQLY